MFLCMSQSWVREEVSLPGSSEWEPFQYFSTWREFSVIFSPQERLLTKAFFFPFKYQWLQDKISFFWIPLLLRHHVNKREKIMPENQRARGQLYFSSHRRCENSLEGPLGFYLLPIFEKKKKNLLQKLFTVPEWWYKIDRRTISCITTPF